MVDFRSLGASANGPVFPTCHAFAPSCADSFDVAVGLSTGEGGGGGRAQTGGASRLGSTSSRTCFVLRLR